MNVEQAGSTQKTEENLQTANAFNIWRNSQACEPACAAINRGDPTTALREAFAAGRASLANERVA